MMKIRVIFKSIFPKLAGANAMVIYPFILFETQRFRYEKNPPYTRRLFRHEWQHVIQVRREGWFRFYASYLWQQITKGYDDNKWEVEARMYEDEPMPDECEQLFYAHFPSLRRLP